MSSAKTLAAFTMLVQDPRALGCLDASGHVLDFDFWDEAKWATDDCELHAQIGLCCLRHTTKQIDQEPTHWAFSAHPTYWHVVRPAPDDKQWIKQPVPDNTARVTALSHGTHGAADGSLTLYLRTSEPLNNAPSATASRKLLNLEYPHVTVDFDPLSTVHYRLLFPEGAVGVPPCLCRTTDGGTTWRVIKRFEDVNAQERDKTVTIRRAPGGWVIFDWERSQGSSVYVNLGTGVEWKCSTCGAVYSPDQFMQPVCPTDGAPLVQVDAHDYEWYSGPVRIRLGGRGLAWAWCLGTPVYPLNEDCYAWTQDGFTLEPDVHVHYSSVVSAVTNGETATLTRITGADGRYYPQLLLRTAHEDVTPWVSKVTFNHAPSFTADVTTTIFDSGNVAGDKNRPTAARWQHGNDFRNATCTLTVRDPGPTYPYTSGSACGFAAGQVVTVYMQLTQDPGLVAIFGGRITSANTDRDASRGVGCKWWTLECSDEAWSLGKCTDADRLGCLAGMRLQDAVRRVCNHGEIPDGRLVFWQGDVLGWTNYAGIASDWTPMLPWTRERVGELRFTPGTPYTDVLDRLCAMCGYKWGVNAGPGSATPGDMALGDICFWRAPGLRTYWQADCDDDEFEMENVGSGTDAQHVMLALSAASSAVEFAPYVRIIGRDSNGREQVAVARRESAITTSSDAYFVGRRWSHVEDCPESTTPWVRAQQVLGELMERSRTYAWRGPCVKTLRADSVFLIEYPASGSQRAVRLVGVTAEIDGAKRSCIVDYRAQGVLEGVVP